MSRGHLILEHAIDQLKRGSQYRRDLDDDLEDDLDDPEEDTDDREKEREKREDHYRDADDEDIMLQKELAEEVRSSMLGRKKKTTQKDTDDDIEFIDL